MAVPMFVCPGTPDSVDSPVDSWVPFSHRSSNSSCACSKCCGRGRFAHWYDLGADSEQDASDATLGSDDPWADFEQDVTLGSDDPDDHPWSHQAQDEAQQRSAGAVDPIHARLRRAIALERQHNEPAAGDHLQPAQPATPPGAPDEQPTAAAAAGSVSEMQPAAPAYPQSAATPPGAPDEPPAAAAPAQLQLAVPAVPPHAHWLASIPDLWRSGWYSPMFADAGPPHEWLDTACGWHHPAYADGNTRHLYLVVGRYNTVVTPQDLEGVLNSFEVSLFRNDRGQFYALADQIRMAYGRRQILIQRGRASCKYTFFSCINCGNYLFVNQSNLGQHRIAMAADEVARRHICTFFNWPMRAPNSEIRYQV